MGAGQGPALVSVGEHGEFRKEGKVTSGLEGGCSKGLCSDRAPQTLEEGKGEAPWEQGRELWAASQRLLRVLAAHLGEGGSGTP